MLIFDIQNMLISVYTPQIKFQLILLFSKDVLHWSKVTVKTFIY